jgi:phosphoribosylaminoimidazolecarboxamide formyltransferase / IMP cyclohydrolase
VSDAQGSAETTATTPSQGALGKRPIRRALVSVYDKAGLDELARGLHEAGVEIVSTGSTAARIASHGIPVTQVSDLTGFPECLDGRVKTLHPAVHAGILADQRLEAHREQLEELGIKAFELVVSNLYPFRETVASGVSDDECVEQIDIGGPSMVRAAAKNHPSVAIVTSPDRYDDVEAALRDGGFTLEQRKRLAAEAFAHTASYDIAVASWFANGYANDHQGEGFPDWVGADFSRGPVLRYGENPHQQAALYLAEGDEGIAHSRQLGGKEMSYNNYVDAAAAQRSAYDFTDPTVAIIKHANPCGIASADDIATAHLKANDCDPGSAYGGVIAANRPVTKVMAEQVAGIFTEVIVAPAYDDDALPILLARKNLRVLIAQPTSNEVEMRPVSGGLLLQTVDRVDAEGDDPSSWKLVTGEPVDAGALADLAFAWRACRSVKSNAIVISRDRSTVGVGMGQVNRVDSARLAVARGGEDRVRGAVAASDAFFPFPDGLEVLSEAGVRAIVEPGGSIRDEEVIAAAAAAGVTLYFTGTRHFFH